MAGDFFAAGRLGMGLTAIAALLCNVARGEEPATLPLKRLDDATRAKVLAALAGLIILGMGMVLLTWLAARVVQRYRMGRSYFRPTPRPSEHDWAKKPAAAPGAKPRED